MADVTMHLFGNPGYERAGHPPKTTTTTSSTEQKEAAK